MDKQRYATYDSPADALQATDEFYLAEGFGYSEEYVTNWIRRHVVLPKKGRVLDLCCGNGIWSKGIHNVNPELELYGIDISAGAITKARNLLGTDEEHFVVGDAEVELPFPDGFFHLIFARGPGLYNQHSMDRPATIRVIESWHNKLAPGGLFYSIFLSRPEKNGYLHADGRGEAAVQPQSPKNRGRGLSGRQIPSYHSVFFDAFLEGK